MAEISKRYEIYQLSPIMGSDKLALEKVELPGDYNSFFSRKEAEEAAIRHKLTYQSFIILRTIFIRN